MISTGLRAKEIVSLRFSDKVYTADGKMGFVYVRKGGKRLITIPSRDAIDAVIAYHELVQIDHDFFFLCLLSNARPSREPISTRTLQRIVNSWGVKQADGRLASPHSCRHTVGNRVFTKGGTLEAQKILGHTSPAITSRFYTQPFFDGSELLKW